MAVKLDIEIGGNAAGFATALNKAKADAKTFASEVGGGLFKNFNTGIAGMLTSWKAGIVAAVSALPIAAYAAFREVAERAREIKIGSQRTGLDTTTYQHVKNVAETAGGDMGEVAHAFDHLAKVQQEIKAGSSDTTKDVSKLQDALVTLGVSLAEIEKASPQAIFFKIAASLKDAAAEGRVTGEQTAALLEVLGRGGAALLPVFARGFNGETQKDLGNLDADTLKYLAERKAREERSWINPAKWWEATKYGLVKSAAWLDQLNEENDPLLKGRRELENPTQEGEAAGAAFARLQNRKRWQQADRDAIERQRAQNDERRFGEEAKKIEAEIAAERLKQGTPEEKRAALLADIKRHEQEISDIRMYQEAGAFSETEARLRIDRESLEIMKRKGALAELDKKHEKTEADKWTRIGLFDRNIYVTSREVVSHRTTAQPAPSNASHNRPGDFIGGIDIGAEPPASTGEDFIGPPEDLDAMIQRLTPPRGLLPQEIDSILRQMTSPLGSATLTSGVGNSALVPASGDNGEASRQTARLLETANRVLQDIATNQRRLADSLT